MFITLLCSAVLSVDFTSDIGKVRPELHSSGFGARIEGCSSAVIDEIKSMGFKSARTHDWALINANQHVCDYHQMFPLIHLDAKDPKNYVFKPTDYLLKRCREEAGLDIFFRLGASIEHSGPKVHFNTLIPEDFDKVAEVFAGTVRHYNKGWGEGYKWNIKYWEIWNEPDGINNMWCLPDGDLGVGNSPEEIAKDRKARDIKRRDIFVKFFVTCLKRLKSEFPEIKVGGPALCWMNESYFRAIFEACKKEGIAPDFISWHHYTGHPPVVMNAIKKGRALCDEYGFKDCELIINEWHYMGPGGFGALRSADPEVRKKVWSGPGSHNGIDSSCFNLTLLSKFQTSKLDQAFYYGCSHTGAWGYKDSYSKYKIYYGLKMFGDFIKDLPIICASESVDGITTFAAKSEDSLRKGVLVVDYRSGEKEIVLELKGVEKDAEIWVYAHDNTRDFELIPLAMRNGKIVLKKEDDGSAAFSIWF